MDWYWILVTLIGICFALYLFSKSLNRTFLPFKPKGKHCYITGGSSGLGLAIAKLLVKQGANVTIVARRKEVLESAVSELEKLRKNESQIIFFVPADVTDAMQATEALKSSELKMGTTVDYVFTCAGASKPGLFHQYSSGASDYAAGMSLNYMGTVYTVKAAVDSWLKNNKRGKIILTSSTLGLLNLVGYSQYCPTKHAIRSFAECLRQEFILLESDVHIYFVSTISTPGLTEEDKTKPRITKEIEGTETSDTSPEARAKTLFKGLKKGYFAITSDFITDLLRIISIGSVPGHSFLDILLLPFAIIFGIGFRWYVNYTLVQERKKCIKKGLPRGQI